jgi:hypothetical protein
MTKCVFHEDRRPSLGLNLSEGNFVCHACGVKGGDVLDFVRQRYGFTFQAACVYLNIERTSRSTNDWLEARKRTREQERIRRCKQFLADEERKLRLEARADIHLMEALIRELGCALKADADNDSAWAALKLADDELKEALSAYFVLSFGSTNDRARFALNEHARPSMCMAMIEAGGVRDDEGRFMGIGQ